MPASTNKVEGSVGRVHRADLRLRVLRARHLAAPKRMESGRDAGGVRKGIYKNGEKTASRTGNALGERME